MKKSSITDIPGPSRLLRTALNRRANAEHNSKKIWHDLNMPASCYDLLKPNIFSLPEKLLRHSSKLSSIHGPNQKSKHKKGVKSNDEYFH